MNGMQCSRPNCGIPLIIFGTQFNCWANVISKSPVIEFRKVVM